MQQPSQKMNSLSLNIFKSEEDAFLKIMLLLCLFYSNTDCWQSVKGEIQCPVIIEMIWCPPVLIFIDTLFF